MTRPIFVSPQGKEYTCHAWACDAFRSGWEWYGFEEPEEDEVYFGLVHGFETEFGYFSAKELKDNNIRLITDAKSLHEIAPPVGWTKKEA